MTDDIKELRDILPRVGEPEGTFCCVEGGLLHRLLGRLEAAEKDAAMLDWLQSQYSTELFVQGQRDEASVVWYVAPEQRTDRWITQSGATLRAAIDAAMQVRP